MDFKVSADEAAWHIREAAADARWGIREAAWSFEERVVWRASDASRAALRRALRALEPLQRLIQTRLVWPLSDRLDDYGDGARTAFATAAVLAAVGAGVAGAGIAGGEEDTPRAIAASPMPVAVAETAASLQGVAPDFVADPNAAAAAAEAPARVAPAPEGAATPEQVAWTFARSFVLYEVGRVDDEVTDSFKTTATPQLAAALGTEPPRLPSAAKVPEAKVLNVVIGKRAGKQLAVSASLLRLKAASELRLTLNRTDDGWRVAEVLG